MNFKLLILFAGILSTINSYGLNRNARALEQSYAQDTCRQLEITGNHSEELYASLISDEKSESQEESEDSELAKNELGFIKSYANAFEDAWVDPCIIGRIYDEIESFNELYESQFGRVDGNAAIKTVKVEFENYDTFQSFLGHLEKAHDLNRIQKIFARLAKDLATQEKNYMQMPDLTDKKFFDAMVENFYFIVGLDCVDLYMFTKKADNSGQ